MATEAAHPAGNDTDTPLSTPALLRAVVPAVVYCALAVYLGAWLLRTRFGERVNRFAASALQDQLATGFPSEEPPIFVIDSTARQSDLAGRATESRSLERILDVLRDPRSRPAAIAVDTDFSPVGDRIEPEHHRFIQYCRRFREETGVPVFLGVFRGRQREGREWLGSREYASMAGGVLAFKKRPELCLSEVRYGSDPNALENIGVRLADAVRPPRKRATKGTFVTDVTDIARRELTRDEAWVEATGFPLDLSPIQFHDRWTIDADAVETGSFDSTRFRDKMVMIGVTDDNAVRGDDVFEYEGELYAGVYHHACAAYTRAHAPLYRLTLPAELLLDLLLILAAVSPTFLACLMDHRWMCARPAWRRRLTNFLAAATLDFSEAHKAQSIHDRAARASVRLNWIVFTLVIAGGIMLARFGRVVWLGFFFAAVGVWADLAIEKCIGLFVRRKKSS